MSRTSREILSQKNIVQGTLADEPEVTIYKGGAKNILFVLVYEQEVAGPEPEEKNSTGYQTQYLRLEAYIPAAQVGQSAFETFHKGNEVEVEYEVRTDSFTGRDGKPHQRTYRAVTRMEPQKQKEDWVHWENDYSEANQVTGTLKKAPTFRVNRNGSQKVWLELLTDQEVRDEKDVFTRDLRLEDVIPQDKVGQSVYDKLHPGDRVAVRYIVRTDRFGMSKRMETQFVQTFLHIRGIRILENEDTAE